MKYIRVNMGVIPNKKKEITEAEIIFLIVIQTGIALR